VRQSGWQKLRSWLWLMSMALASILAGLLAVHGFVTGDWRELVGMAGSVWLAAVSLRQAGNEYAQHSRLRMIEDGIDGPEPERAARDRVGGVR
jgi:hypothetical protein